MNGRRDELGRELARFGAQLRGDRRGRAVDTFLEGLSGGLFLGAALALIAARREAVAGIAPLPEASIELKARATHLAQEARAGADALVGQAGGLTEEAKATLDRLVPGDESAGG